MPKPFIQALARLTIKGKFIWIKVEVERGTFFIPVLYYLEYVFKDIFGPGIRIIKDPHHARQICLYAKNGDAVKPIFDEMIRIQKGN